MAKYVICVDGGTTNTRLVLMKDGTECDRIKMNTGAGSTAKNGNNNELKEQFKIHLNKLLDKHNLAESDIEQIILSGMICSELGLHCVPHVKTLAGAKELKNACENVVLSDITSIPMTFIPGVKTVSENVCEMDIMRGEETELTGIRKLLNLNDSFVLMLPGTHNKIIFADGDGRIVNFFTAMSGELTKTVCDNTILKEALDGGFTKTPDTDAGLFGYDTAEELGVTSALFKVRILSKFSDCSAKQLYSFLLGVILHEDVLLAQKKADGCVIVAGSEPFKSALKCILDNRTALPSEILSDDISDRCVSVGQLEIVE